MTTSKPRAARLDSRTVARLDAAVIECSDREQKQSHKVLIEQFAKNGITVTFDHCEKSVYRLGLKWRDVFLPATRLERGHPEARTNGDKPNATGQGHDMQAVLDRIERLEDTLTTQSLAEYRGLHRQAHEQAELAKGREAAMRTHMQTLLERIDRILERLGILYNIVGSVKLEHDRQKAARSLFQQPEDASAQEPQP